MDQRAGDVSFLDGRVQLLRLATADAGDEIREMIAARLPMRPGVLVAAEPAFIAESVLIAFGQVSVRPVKDVTDRVVAIEQAVAEAGFVVRDPMPDFELHHLAMTVGLIEFERAIEGVRRLLVVIEHEVAAERLCVPCCTIRWYFSAARTSWRPSHRLCEHGFSTYTSLPAWQAQIAISACQWLGVAIEIASMVGSSSNRRTSTNVRGLPLIS